jgi:hypothetical protein
MEAMGILVLADEVVGIIHLLHSRVDVSVIFLPVQCVPTIKLTMAEPQLQ